jgi:GNAT superfamily N-acetyltransferase
MTKEADMTAEVDVGRAGRGEALVRRLGPDDVEQVISLDARITGRRREQFFRLKLSPGSAESGVHVSLAAEVDGLLRGFLLARVYYGEFGVSEPVAVLDTIGVHPSFRGAGTASALLRQLRTNLRGLGVGALETQVGWDEQELIRFFHGAGFRPAARLCLSLDLEEAARADEAREAEASP